MKNEEYRSLTTKDKIAFFAMVIGMFMAVLDIQIVASSLSVIGAGLSAGPDELSWVQTAYIIAEVIIIPMTGFVAQLLSTRISYFIASLGFTIMSIMCSIAWNIESMIVFRALQGFFGGAMIPTVFATTFIIFPPKMRPTINIIMGLTVTVAPTLGPTIGGYITEIASWHFMFLVNVLPGVFVCATVFLFAHFDEPNPNLLKNFDYIGVILMVISLGTLQYILEGGNPKGWMDSNIIITISSISIVAFIAFFYHELSIAKPIIHLRTFKHKNFALGSVFGFVLGIGLYGAVYILPLFLYRITGMDTFQIGLVMMVTGIFQFLAAPIAGKLYSTNIDGRIMLGFGMCMFALGCYLNANLTPDSNFWELFMPQACRGFALMFCFIPINDIALGTIEKSQVQNASGLYNLMRNLGGAIGLAVLNSKLIDNTKIFGQYLSDNVRFTDPNVVSNMNNINGIFDGSVWDANLAGVSMLNMMVQRDAFVISMNTAFMGISLIFLISTLGLPFIDKVERGAEPIGGH